MPYYVTLAEDSTHIQDVFYENEAPAGGVEVCDADGEAIAASGCPGAYILVSGTVVVDEALRRISQLACEKSDKIVELKIACSSSIYGGFISDALGAAFHYPAKDKDQQNLAASVVDSLIPGLPEDWTTPFWCCDAAGTWAFKPHTAAQIQQVGRDGKAAILQAMARNAQLQEQLLEASTVEQLEAIQW